MQIYELFEILMLVCFGASWPNRKLDREREVS